MAVKDAEHQLNLEISENETRKDFSKAERIDYARKLERVESLKAEHRRRATQNNNSAKEIADMEIFPSLENGKVRDIVAEKMNIGSGKQYEKEKFITDNKSSLTPEDFINWDEGKLSTNKAFQKVKQQLQVKDKQISEYEQKLQAAQNQLSSKETNISKLKRDIYA